MKKIIKVAYLGPKGTYTGEVARKIYPLGELSSMPSIRHVIKAVEIGKFNYGVVPAENFYNGEVRQTLDALLECENARVIAETSLEIIHCLGGLKNSKIINKIYSKDQALEQCSLFLMDNYPLAKLISVESTSSAAAIIQEQRIVDGGAIASKDTLMEYKLEIIANDICPNNRTRFFILGNEKTRPTGNDKTFLAIYPLVRDRPGVLYNSLGVFAILGINLEYIQSRPDGKKGYHFYFELIGHSEDEIVKKGIETLRLALDPSKKHKDVVKVLGSYPNTNWKD